MATVIPYYYSHSRCGRVRIIIAPFGYGPKVAAETLAKLLNISIGEWHINSTQITNVKFQVTYNFGVAQPLNEPETSYKIWVDCLMWLRNKLPTEVADYDLFLAENFFPTNPLLHAQVNGSRIKDIAPLYSLNGHSGNNKTNVNIHNAGHILVSFGGVETPFTTDVHRYVIPEIVLKALVIASRELQDKRKIICCLPPHILKEFQISPIFSDIEFISPNQKEFMAILNNASIYIVQPGLYGPFEAFENGIPTVFTTPFSYTQFCQAKAYDSEKLLGHVPMWKQLENEIGNLIGDVEKEEEYCFNKLSTWINKNVNDGNFTHYYEWANNVLQGKNISKNTTINRMHFVTNSKNKEGGILAEIISNM